LAATELFSKVMGHSSGSVRQPLCCRKKYPGL